MELSKEPRMKNNAEEIVDALAKIVEDMANKLDSFSVIVEDQGIKSSFNAVLMNRLYTASKQFIATVETSDDFDYMKKTSNRKETK